MQLAEDIAHVVLGGLGSDVELGTEFLIRLAAGDVLKHFAFALCERVGVGGLREPAKLAKDQCCKRWREHRFARSGCHQGPAQFVDWRGLEEIASSSCRNGIEQVSLGFANRQNDDRADCGALLDHGEAAATRHVKIAHHEVGLSCGDHVDCAIGVVGLADDIEVAGEFGPQPGPDELVVVGENRSNRSYHSDDIVSSGAESTV